MGGAGPRRAGSSWRWLKDLPAGADWASARAALVKSELDWLKREFDTSGARAGATPAKLEGILEGEVGKLVAPAATAIPPAVLGEVLTAAPALTDPLAERLTGVLEEFRGEMAGTRLPTPTWSTPHRKW
ncbi:hypothetical protein [Muricoccus radiodurans]|uniref:hypothetical protein n=1 Tax=Muricoccus radiodurans TaxID=2231721 RepID=UPI003CF711A6